MRLILAVSFLLISTTAVAQSTENDLKARLIHKPLYLRGLWIDDDLQFDAAGKNSGSSGPTSFTIGGVEIDSLELMPAALVLKGHRVGLEFKGNLPHRVGLKMRTPSGFGRHDEKMSIALAIPAGGNFTAALDAIFTDELADLVSSMPVEWQEFASREVLHESAVQPTGEIHSDVHKIGAGHATAPVVLDAPTPEYSEAARGLAYSGKVLVYLQVNTAGIPMKVRIIKPAGVGLDERAVDAVKAYKFNPAMEDGKPVPVEMNVEVNFRVY